MPRFIIKITDDKIKKDYYMEWSTVVDAPVTYGLDLEEFKKYYKKEYGENGMRELTARLEKIKNI